MVVPFKAKLLGMLLGAIIGLAACVPNESGAPTDDVPQLIEEETLPPATNTPLRLPSPISSMTPTRRTTRIAPIRPSSTLYFVTPTPPDTPTPSLTPTHTKTPTTTFTRTLTPTRTLSPTPTRTPSRTPSITPTRLVVMPGCDFAWFFTPPIENCPLTDFVNSNAAYQPFEGGFMIWIEAESSIYIFFGDTSFPAWTQAIANFSTDNGDQNLNPPSGRFRPERGFGNIWRNTLDLQTRLGWAVAPAVLYTSAIQMEAASGARYLLGANGEVFRLESDLSAWGRQR